MGEEITVLDVQAINSGTLIQIDFKGETTGGRMFVNIRDVFKALNNYLQEAQDRSLLAQGFELEDPENYKNPHLIN